LKTNLRNAASTFGESSHQYRMVQSMVQDYIRQITAQQAPHQSQGQPDPKALNKMFENLSIRPKKA
jgi:hypothetical protein